LLHGEFEFFFAEGWALINPAPSDLQLRCSTPKTKLKYVFSFTYSKVEEA
jgi:hypothetical protein